MMRSAEYCARLDGGMFDLNRVLLVKNIVFKKNGRITTDYDDVHEAEITFGKTKTTAGGENRSHFWGGHALCVVKALAHMFKMRPHRDPSEPLFAWPEESRRPGQGVRYCDMLTLVKEAAKDCGQDKKDYGTHSFRKGGASCYVLAKNMTIDHVKSFGRWKGSSVQLYIEPAVGRLFQQAHADVIRGQVDHSQVHFQSPARDRAVRRQRAAEAVKQVLAQM